jgi:hypothetical protein
MGITRQLLPSAKPIVGAAILERLSRFAQPESPATPLIASDARKCARQISLRLFGIPKDISYTPAELATFRRGDWYGLIVQEVLAAWFDARIEVPFDLSPAPISGKADAHYENTAVETKSTSRGGFDAAIGEFRNVLAGPKAEWLVQGGMAGIALEADWLLIVLIDTETSPRRLAEWLIDLRHQPLTHLPDPDLVGDPTVADLVDVEVRRQLAILAEHQAGVLSARDIPGYGRVEQRPPARGKKGPDPWNCAYCSWQPSCSKLPAGPAAITAVRETLEGRPALRLHRAEPMSDNPEPA